MNKWRILFSLIVLAGCIVFIGRRQSLQQLKTEQVQLQNEQKPNLAPPVASVQAAPTNPDPERLSAEERSELLRLRSQVSGLRQDLMQESNQLASVSRTRRPASDATEETWLGAAQAAQKVTLGRQWAVAILMYANDHDGQLPAAMADAASYAGMAGTNDELELVRSGPLHSGTNEPLARTILLREKKPWRGPSGRW